QLHVIVEKSRRVCDVRTPRFAFESEHSANLMWNPLRYLRRTPSAGDIDAQHELLWKQAPIQCLWMFGKTGSGKTSIIRSLTGAQDAEIGAGFRPQTRQSRLYDFPADELPIVRFLDTRGLGEAAYDAE